MLTRDPVLLLVTITYTDMLLFTELLFTGCCLLVVVIVYLTECNVYHFKFLVVEHSLQVTVKHFQSTTQRALDILRRKEL